MQGPQNDLSETINQVEGLLCNYYQFYEPISVNDHILDTQEYTQHRAAENPDLRAATVFCQNNDELFIGLYLDESLRSSLVQNNPMIALNQSNLDTLCVLVEEISHFHLICQRAQRNRKLSQLEIEWQGEVDKLLICALVLKEQDGRWYFKELAHLLYDLAVISHPNWKLYEEATRLASGFWQGLWEEDIINSSCIKGVELQSFMQVNYHSPWHEKYPIQKNNVKYCRSRYAA